MTFEREASAVLVGQPLQEQRPGGDSVETGGEQRMEGLRHLVGRRLGAQQTLRLREVVRAGGVLIEAL